MKERVYRLVGVDVSTKKIAIGMLTGASTGQAWTYSWEEVSDPGDHMADRFRGLVERFRKALERLKPIDMAFVEDITFTRGRQGEIGLAKVLGAVEAHLLDCGIPYEVVNNATWRSGLGIAGRKGVTKTQRKRRSVDYARDKLAVDPPNHDVGDALCILQWGMLYRLSDPKVRGLIGP